MIAGYPPQGDHPDNWRATDPRTEQLEKFGKVSEWPRASRSSSHVGGMSSHAFFSPVVLGLACWWLSLVWLGAGASGACAPGAGLWVWRPSRVSLFVCADPRTGFLPQVSP